MMVEMARVPPNLDRVMNEGIAFVINRFVHQIPECPLGQRPVMIGRRKRSYDTLDKVMKRLDLIINTMSAMNFIVIDRFKSQIPKCPVGQRPVMIGRRKRTYDTLDKVMKRLDLIMNTMSAVNFIVIDIH